MHAMSNIHVSTKSNNIPFEAYASLMRKTVQQPLILSLEHEPSDNSKLQYGDMRTGYVHHAKQLKIHSFYLGALNNGNVRLFSQLELYRHITQITSYFVANSWPTATTTISTFYSNCVTNR